MILIEIDDETTDGHVLYSYTDFDILVAIAEGYLHERPWAGRGKPAKCAREEADEILKNIETGGRREEVKISKKCFLRISSADTLLGVMGLTSGFEGDVVHIRNAYSKVKIGDHGKSAPSSDVEVSALHWHISKYCEAQPTAASKTKVQIFEAFDWVKATLNGA